MIAPENLDMKYIEKFLIEEKGYIWGSLQHSVLIPNTHEYVDMAIFNTKKDIIGIVELQRVDENSILNEERKSHLKSKTENILRGRPDNTQWFTIFYFKNDQKIEFLCTSIKNGVLINDTGLRSLQDFPSLEELMRLIEVGTRQNEEIKVNKDYGRFRIFSRILGVATIFLFAFSIRHCEVIVLGRWQHEKICGLIIGYPQLILFGIAIVLILIPFPRKIKTMWFKLNWDKVKKQKQ